MSDLTRADFENALNTNFTMVDGDRTVGVFELVEVIASPHPALPHLAHAGRPFSILLLGRHTTVAPQGSYTFESAALGRQTFFIVPVGQSEAGVTYEAVFN